MITNDIAPLKEVRDELIELRNAALEDARWEETIALSHAIAWLHKLLPMEQREAPGISSKNQIYAYLHCPECLQELVRLSEEQGSAKPRLYTRYELGWTPTGFQARCVTHNANIIHVDLHGETHQATVGDTT